MIDNVSVTLPLFLVIGLGFIAARTRLLSSVQFQGIGSFVMVFAVPALLFKALAERAVAEILDYRFLLAFAVGSLAVFGIGLLVTRLRGGSLADGAITAMGMSISNSGYIGYPMAAAVLGAPAALAMALCMMVENLLVIPLTIILSGMGRGKGALKTLSEALGRLLRNPLILAILAGLSFSVLGLSLPQAIGRSVNMLAQTAAPAALFVLGGTLYGMKVKGMFREIAPIATGKLILHPLLVAGAIALTPGIDPVLRTAGVLFASAPMFTIYPLFGEPYGLASRSAAAVVVTTALSFVTMSIWLALLPMLGG